MKNSLRELTHRHVDEDVPLDRRTAVGDRQRHWNISALCPFALYEVFERKMRSRQWFSTHFDDLSNFAKHNYSIRMIHIVFLMKTKGNQLTRQGSNLHWWLLRVYVVLHPFFSSVNNLIFRPSTTTQNKTQFNRFPRHFYNYMNWTKHEINRFSTGQKVQNNSECVDCLLDVTQESVARKNSNKYLFRNWMFFCCSPSLFLSHGDSRSPISLFLCTQRNENV